MTERIRATSGSPYEATFGFARAVRVDDRIIVAGTGPVEPDGSTTPGGAAEQAARCCAIIVAAIEELALAKSEAVYLTRNTDSSGQRLSEDCTYRLTGGAMPAGWWSVTLYDAQSMLPANTDGALSIDASRAGSGAWEAVVAPERPADATHWISSRKAGAFDLTLRLYMPEPALLETPARTLRCLSSRPPPMRRRCISRRPSS
jgi:hypothetical protein